MGLTPCPRTACPLRSMEPADQQFDFDRTPMSWLQQTENTPVQSSKKATVKRSERRREQNRLSQRAYRERKENHVKSLESQLQSLCESHEILVQSYRGQAREVGQLEGRLARLKAELQTLRASHVRPLAEFCCSRAVINLVELSVSGPIPGCSTGYADHSPVNPDTECFSPFV
ncbi:hypothetical protein PV08_00573 [Exophiala spinifera]|uniref:BZIP domain-containing protein n=1 Tax=Exophiala spinifera TaxID=91928 RepID=A0A0D2BM79_9EURO|nr:uncharacterized protein PV08_00573 [Exophiala spinifera]KIW19998.1 hypothetical protein PV08_00573 [Exophiala spinifera]